MRHSRFTPLRAALLSGCISLGLLASSSAAGAAAVVAPGLNAAEHMALARSGAFVNRPIRVLILGDSIALTLGIGLAVGAQKEYGISVRNHSTLGCDLDPSLAVITSGKIGPATSGCRAWRALWPFLTADVHPEVVALGVGRWENADHYYRGHWVHVGQPVWDAHVKSDLRDAIAIFKTFGAKVVLFTMPYIDPSDTQPDGVPWVENTAARTRAFNRLVVQVARADPTEVTVVGLNRMLSPQGVYSPVVDGVAARWTDGVHITIAGGLLLQPEILPVLDRLGLEAEKAARHDG